MGHTHCTYLNVCVLYHIMFCVCFTVCTSLFWGGFKVNLKSGTNILYWRTTGILVGGKMVKPVLLKNIQIEGKTLNMH